MNKHMFEIEIKYIQNIKLRKRAKQIMSKTRHLIAGPSSYSGQYHPPDEFCKQGMYIHCRRVCWWVNELCKEANISGYKRDCMFIAAMVHDIGRVIGFSSNHGTIAAQYLKNNCDVRAVLVLQLCKTHMWHWDAGSLQPTTLVCRTFAFADFCASRREILTPFLE